MLCRGNARPNAPIVMLAKRLNRTARYAYLRKVPIRIYLCPFDALEVLTLDERLYAFLYHVNFRFKLSSQLAESLKKKLLV